MTKRRNPFTLVELLVAVGLLSLIMMLLLQLFSGAQKIWIASEKTNNVYADSRVAMELMADLFNTIQFSHGVDSATGNRVKSKDMIFSLNTSKKDDGRYSSSIIFVSKTASRDLPMKDNTTRFISFRLGKSDNADTRGKLFMVIYSDKNNEKTFYSLFPTYDGGSRDTAKGQLEGLLNTLVNNYSNTSSGENEFCQVVAENVVEFKLTAYRNNVSTGKLEKKADDTDFAEPPYMIEIQLTVLDPDSYKQWLELDGETKTNYLDRHKRTFSRNVFIGDRWALEAQEASGGSGS